MTGSGVEQGGGSLAWGGAAILLLLAALTLLPEVPEPAAPPRPHAPSSKAGSPAFPPRLARPAEAERSVAEPRLPVWTDHPRQAYERAADLHAFVHERLAAALAGDAAANHVIYLALEECHWFLLEDAQSVLALNQRMLVSDIDLSPFEQRQWALEYQRCLGFSVNGVDAIGTALGDARPGVVTAFASVFFDRAVRRDYAPALVELAYRPGPLDTEGRRELLQLAAASGDPEAYWLLFTHGEAHDGVQTEDLAWLNLACRLGWECGDSAAWYRDHYCVRQACPRTGEPLDVIAARLAPGDAQRAGEMAAALERAILAGDPALPLPPLQ